MALPPAILVADDMEVVRSLCRNALTPCGYEVLEAADGDTALRLFEEHQSRVVFSLIDVAMPGPGGIDLIRRLFDLRPEARAALISGGDAESMVPPDLADRCLALNKPFTVSKLRQLIQSGRQAAAAGA